MNCIFKRKINIIFFLQRKYKTVQKLEGATQKSLDEEIKSSDNISIESTSQKPKTADEDSAQSKSDSLTSTNSILLKTDGKPHGTEETKEKCSCSASTSASAAQNGQNVNAQEKDAVDSAENPAMVASQSKEYVTSDDKANGT